MQLLFLSALKKISPTELRKFQNCPISTPRFLLDELHGLNCWHPQPRGSFFVTSCLSVPLTLLEWENKISDSCLVIRSSKKSEILKCSQVSNAHEDGYIVSRHPPSFQTGHWNSIWLKICPNHCMLVLSETAFSGVESCTTKISCSRTAVNSFYFFGSSEKSSGFVTFPRQTSILELQVLRGVPVTTHQPWILVELLNSE